MSILFLITFMFFVLRPQDFMPELIGVPVIQVLLLVGLSMWVFSKDKRPVYFPLALAAAFMVVAGFSIGINGWWGGMPDAFSRLMPALVLFILAASSTQKKRDFDRFAWVLIACSAILVYHGWQQTMTGVGFTGMPMVDGRIQYVGVFNDPNDLGLLFVVGIVAAGYLFSSNTSNFARALAVASMLWSGYGVLLTQSRGTLLACIAVAACVGVRKYGVTRSLMFGAILLPILWGATRLATVSNEEESAEGRIDAWYEGFQMLRENPAFGVGFGNFTDHNYLTAHNSLVLVMAETGLIGYTLWFAFLGYGVRAVYRASNLKDSASDERLLAARTVLLMCVGVFVAVMFLSRSYNALLFILCGLAIARHAAEAERAALIVPESHELSESPGDAGSLASAELPATAPMSQQMKPILLTAFASVPFMFVLTKILLSF